MHTSFLATSALAFGLAVSTGAALADVELVFRYNDPEVAEIEAALAEFEAANPGITVELERLAWPDARTQFLREAAVGTGPDVLHIAFVWPLEMARAGALLSLDDLVEENGIQNGWDDFVATDLARDEDGTIWAIPWTTDTYTLAYNTDVLEEAGVEIPQTWDELLAASRAIHEKTGKIGFGFPAGSSATNTIWFLANYHWWSNGHALVVEDGAGGFTTGIDAATIADTIRYYQSFMGEGGNPASNVAVSSWSDPAILEPMISGEQGIAFVTPTTFREIVDAYQERHGTEENPFVTGTIPKGSAGGISHLGGRSLGINAATEHPEEAYKLVQHLTRESFFKDHLTVQLPAQRALLDSMDFGPGFGGFAEQLQNGRSWGPYANEKTPIGTMWSDTGREFGAVFIDEKTPEQAAEALLSSVQTMLNK